MNYTIKHITTHETYAVRHPVLRAGKPLKSSIFVGDNLKTTLHLGLFSNEKLIAVCSFLKNRHNLLSEEKQFQLRGMAVLKEFQGLGLGKLLLEQGEYEIKQGQVKVIWCNARETAVNFYKKCHYQIIGQSFNIESIGSHYTMYKNL